MGGDGFRVARNAVGFAAASSWAIEPVPIWFRSTLAAAWL